MKFGEWLSRLREERIWTQGELARRAGVSLSTVQKAEASDSIDLGPTTTNKIATAFDTTAQQFVKMWETASGRIVLTIELQPDVSDKLRQVPQEKLQAYVEGFVNGLFGGKPRGRPVELKGVIITQDHPRGRRS